MTPAAADPHARTVLVLAKAPVPGRVKTRLCPPLTPAEAARLAEAALADTLDAVLACAADRRVLVLDGAPGPWLPRGIEVVPQHGAGLAERLARAWAGPLGAATLQIGMDTPQVSPTLLDLGFALLEAPGADAVLGLAGDGGWWAIGMRRADPQVFDGVPMSDPSTGTAQLAALTRRGHRVRLLPLLRDVDTAADLQPVVAECPPAGRFVSIATELGVAACTSW